MISGVLTRLCLLVGCLTAMVAQSSVRHERVFGLDSGEPGKAGVLTKVGQASSLSPAWSGASDPLGCLLRTTEITITNGLTNTAFANVIDHYYDPQVEFLELGVVENGKPTWKILGPDLDGTYGGQNGTGGFDAIVPGPELFCPLITDVHGKGHAVYDVRHASLMWHPSRVSANGAVPGYRPVPLGQAGPDLAAKCAWRNRWMASFGLICMYGNWLDPVSAQFLGFDEMGHAAGTSIGGHSTFNGSPLRFWDPDGRLSKQLNGINPLDQFEAGLARFDTAMERLGQGLAGSLAQEHSQRPGAFYARDAAHDWAVQQWGQALVSEGYDRYWSSQVQGAQRELAGQQRAAGLSGVYQVDSESAVVRRFYSERRPTRYEKKSDRV